MSYRIYPVSYVVLISVIFLISWIFLKNLTKMSLAKFLPKFFLGVGFMLMKQKVSQNLQNYGSTWFVVSIVITAILSMAYLANLFVIKGFKISINQIFFFNFISFPKLFSNFC